MLDPQVLKQMWAAVATHLWQSIIVIAVLLLPYMLLRNGPARLRDMLWSIALIKLFLPLPLLVRLWEPLARHITPVLPSFLRGFFGSGLAGRVTHILDPAGFGVMAGPAVQSGNAALYITLTAAWLLGAGWLTYRWARERNAPGLKGGGPVAGTDPQVRMRVLVALAKRIALTAFFYYPPLWAVLRQLNSSCEMACDQADIRAGVKPSAFARALARTLELGLSPAPAPAGLGIKARSTIQNRFDEISQPRRLVTMRRHRVALLSAITLAVLITAFPLPSCVKEGDPPPPPKPPEVAEAPPITDKARDEDSVKPPALIQETMVLPEYPEAERKAGIEGAVVLEARILKDGSVGEITVVEGVESHPSLEESARDALSQWKFEPATEDGEPVEMAVQIPLAFRLDDHDKTGGEAKTGGGETMPQLIPESIVKPEYPEEARKMGITGKVIIEAEVKPDGTPGSITVKEGIPGYPAFDDKAVEAVKQWRFRPGTRDGRPVAATVMIPLEFNLDDKK